MEIIFDTKCWQHIIMMVIFYRESSTHSIDNRELMSWRIWDVTPHHNHHYDAHSLACLPACPSPLIKTIEVKYRSLSSIVASSLIYICMVWDEYEYHVYAEADTSNSIFQVQNIKHLESSIILISYNTLSSHPCY
jgi:hypothetical protein